MQWLKLIVSTIGTFACVILFSTNISLLPPLGSFFSPSHGFWQNSLHDTAKKKQLTVSGLTDKVEVRYDDRMIPHIFAQNDRDLYFAQGYITARDRLWQMEFQTHAAAGRLSEIFGRKILGRDRLMRRAGMVFGAKNSLKEMEKDKKSKEAVQAYTDGVNAYIATLCRASYPVEYKLFDYRPEPWTPLKCALMLKYMSWTLTGYNRDLADTMLARKFDEKTYEDLFPLFPKDVDPIIPKNTSWDFTPKKIEKPKGEFIPRYLPDEFVEMEEKQGGSNNWAVNGKKTKSGKPLLSNDPHLGLNLPSIWYELQLTAPGVNVYGVSLPGVPTIIIGFNSDIAWGVTNSSIDVDDCYEIEFKDDSRQEYRHDGAWKKTTIVEEKYKVRGEKDFVDPVVYTHHGPVVVPAQGKLFHGKFPANAAFRWVAHDPSNEMMTFFQLNRAGNYSEYVEALKHFQCPAQNFVFACADGDIAIWHNGKFPLKWQGQGRFILDGTNPKHEWPVDGENWIPHEHNPHVKNPQRNFVSSANQHPTDTSYPYHMYGRFEHYRNVRINERLAQMENIDKENFRQLQLDNKNLLAASVLPKLLQVISKQKMTGEQQKSYDELKNWNYFNDAEKIAPSIFEQWWRLIRPAIWKDELQLAGRHSAYPSSHRTAQLIIDEPNAKWFDNVKTKESETLSDIAWQTFEQACAGLNKKHGIFGKNWVWWQHKNTSISFLVPQIRSFGHHKLKTGGGRSIVNATSDKWGPSWRMIVSLEKPIKTWGIYPGGQSGHPGSKHYDDFIDTWSKGQLAPLLYLTDKDQKDQRIVAQWTLSGK